MYLLWANCFLLQKNKDAVNLTLGKIQGSHLLETDPDAVMYERYWSSDEYSQDHAWYITMPSGEVDHSWKYAFICCLSPDY